jgi:hypothetical protein
MNDLDTELEAAICSALITDAARAPRPAPQWDGLAQYSTSDRERRRSPWVAAAAVGLVAAAIGGAIALRPSTSSRVVRTAGFIPAGTEFPLTDLGPATQSVPFGGVTTDRLLRGVSVPGHNSLTVVRTLIYVHGPTAERAECISPGTNLFCLAEEMGSLLPKVFHFYGEAGSNGVPEPPLDLAVWTNVPADAAYVSFIGGAEELWQRPVLGMAVFPTLGLATAYTADGTELTRIDMDKASATDPLINLGPPLDVSDAQGEELGLLTNSTMASCLNAHGGISTGNSTTGDGNVVVFDPSVNQVEIWDGCVTETKRIVAERVTSMNPPQVKTS